MGQYAKKKKKERKKRKEKKNTTPKGKVANFQALWLESEIICRGKILIRQEFGT